MKDEASVARVTSLLEQTLKNTSSEGPSSPPAIFVQTLTTAHPKERTNKYGQDPQHNPIFMQSAPSPTLAPAPAPTFMDAFANEPHKTESKRLKG